MARLIHQSQIDRLNVDIIKGISREEHQRFRSSKGQVSFMFTVLPIGTKIVSSVIEINGVNYEEKNGSNPHGSFTRSGNLFTWDFVEANGGFDFIDDMNVVIFVNYLASDEDIPLQVQSVNIPNASSNKVFAIGDYETDPNGYFEQYGTETQNIEEFLGLNVNGAFYSHPNMVSYNAESQLITLNKLKLSDSDRVSVVSNTTI